MSETDGQHHSYFCLIAVVSDCVLFTLNIQKKKEEKRSIWETTGVHHFW